MPYTRKQVKYLLSKGSPLSDGQQEKMKSELHSDPALGHKQKGSKAMQKHKATYRHTMITHHSDGSHTVEHHPHAKAASKSGAFMEAGEPKTYSAHGHELLGKLKEHLGLEHAAKDAADAEEEEIETA